MGLFRKKELNKRSAIGVLTHDDFPSAFFNGYTPLDKHPEFVAAVDKVADLVSNMTIQLIDKDPNGHEKRIRNELSKKLDINPNKYMTRKTFVSNIVRNLMLYGNHVAYPAYAGEYLDNLIPIDYSRLKYESTTLGYRILIDDKPYEPSNLLHFVLNPDPRFPYIGKGYRVVLSDILDNLSVANQTKKNYMSQKYSPSMIISVEADGSAEAWKNVKQGIINDYVSSDDAGAPMVIPTSLMDVKSVKPLTLQDLALNDAVEIDKKTVAAILGIPAFVLGVGEFDRDEYNNFIETKVKSIATIIQQEMTVKLIYSPTMFIRLNHHSLLDYSLTDWATIGKDLKAIGVLNGNEVRNKVGFEYVDLPEMNEYTMLENYIRLEDVGNQKKLDKGGE